MPEVKKETSPAGSHDTTQTAPPSTPETFTLAQISDLHLTSLDKVSIRPLLNKRMLGYLSWWRKRRFIHRREVVDALLKDLETTRPDHIAVTGDLTHLGLPCEFAEAGRWLDRLGPPGQVTLIPGNHEAYVGRSWSEQLSDWADYLESDDLRQDRQTTGFFPSLRIRGPIALLGLCSARPSLPFLAVGSLDERQLEALAELLQATGKAGLMRIILVHHPPVPETIKWRKRLDDARALTEVITRHGAELVLHGHTHAPTFTLMRTAGGDIPVIGAASASELNPHSGRCAQYNLFVIKQNGAELEVKMLVRSYRKDSGCFDHAQETSLVLPRCTPMPKLSKGP